LKKFPFSIYDAHHHLWDLGKVDYPWLAAKGVVRFFGDPSPIQKNYLPSDLIEDFGDLPVKKTVHIQVGADDHQHLLESQTVQQMADDSGLANAIVAFCELEKPTCSTLLDELGKLNNFRGIRQIIGRSPQEDSVTGTDALLQNPRWLEGLVELQKRSLSFDLQLIPDQMQSAAKILSKVPNLRVAVCHCGSPWYRDKQGWAMWKDGLESLAERPNTYCKISGLSMFDHNWTIESLAPVINTVLDIFGPERCMFGSNYPVDKLHTDYARLWYAYLKILEQYQPTLTNNDKRRLFKDNCGVFYNIT
jgi:predicted TIM-barrel fold metal-dependent hydrolase